MSLTIGSRLLCHASDIVMQYVSGQTTCAGQLHISQKHWKLSSVVGPVNLEIWESHARQDRVVWRVDPAKDREFDGRIRSWFIA